MTQRTPNGTAYKDQGQPGAPAVVLIHGLGLNKDVWQWLSPALNKNYRVITYDLFGHGESVAPPAVPTLSLFCDQLDNLRYHCGIETVSILGFSLGGMIARRFAQDHPNRITAMGVLHSPHQRAAEAQDAILKRVVQARTDGPSSTIEAALERWFTDAFRQQHPEMIDLVRSWVTANDISIYHTIYQVLADGIDEITAPVPAITCPTIVITGDEDFGNGPEMSRAIAAEIEGAEVHILQGLRHMALAEAPDAVNLPLVNFLDRVVQG